MTESRRAFLRLFGSSLAATSWPLGIGPAGTAGAALAVTPRPTPFGMGFTPVRPGHEDALRLPPGFTWDVIATWGDVLPGTSQRFGFNGDYTAFLPIGTSGDEGVLWVNHEYVRDPKQAFSAYDQAAPVVLGHAATLDDELTDIGASVLHLRRTGQRWGVVASPLTRRYDVRSRLTPTGPALRGATDVGGTLANCSGCHTPWNTVLSCEENFQDVVPEAVDTDGRGTVGGRFNRNGAHFGWVCEFDPLDPSFTPVKHTALGRFRHENVALRVAPGRPAVAYMGDDRIDGHVYRFVSTQSYAPGSARNRGSLLASGRLYAAVFHADGTGIWRELAEGTPLAPNPNSPHPAVPVGALLLGDVYRDLGAIVTDAFHASNLVGATECGRPEDVEVRPADGAVYIAFTAAAERGARLFSNPYGEIWRIQEDGDGTGLTFTWTRWQAGGPNDAARAGRVFAAPDNLSFDRAGHIWVVTDMSSKALAGGDPAYSAFGNNGIFVISLEGDDAGLPRQFASGPSESELTGPSWTPAEDTLFLSVQHPGEGHGVRLDRASPLGSNWPSGVAGRHPKPGVVAIRRR
jgi:secreted PhoX family phosphatase